MSRAVLWLMFTLAAFGVVGIGLTVHNVVVHDEPGKALYRMVLLCPGGPCAISAVLAVGFVTTDDSYFKRWERRVAYLLLGLTMAAAATLIAVT